MIHPSPSGRSAQSHTRARRCAQCPLLYPLREPPQGTLHGQPTATARGKVNQDPTASEDYNVFSIMSSTSRTLDSNAPFSRQQLSLAPHALLRFRSSTLSRFLQLGFEIRYKLVHCSGLGRELWCACLDQRRQDRCMVATMLDRGPCNPGERRIAKAWWEATHRMTSRMLRRGVSNGCGGIERCGSRLGRKRWAFTCNWRRRHQGRPELSAMIPSDVGWKSPHMAVVRAATNQLPNAGDPSKRQQL